jgi:hypothetical protein
MYQNAGGSAWSFFTSVVLDTFYASLPPPTTLQYNKNISIILKRAVKVMKIIMSSAGGPDPNAIFFQHVT